MNKNTNVAFVLILLLALVAAYLVWPIQHPSWVNSLLFWQPEGARSLEFRQGLDLRGGLQVLMVADVPEDAEVTSGALETARQVVENRVNALSLAARPPGC